MRGLAVSGLQQNFSCTLCESKTCAVTLPHVWSTHDESFCSRVCDSNSGSSERREKDAWKMLSGRQSPRLPGATMPRVQRIL